MSAYVAGCRQHPWHEFEPRSTHAAAYDDAVAHTFTAGGHHIEVLTVEVDGPIED